MTSAERKADGANDSHRQLGPLASSADMLSLGFNATLSSRSLDGSGSQSCVRLIV